MRRVNLFSIILLLLLIAPLSHKYVGSIQGAKHPTVKSSDPTINVETQLDNSLFYTVDPSEKFSSTARLNISPSGAIDLNNVGIDYMLILDGSGSVQADGWNTTLYWAMSFINNTRDIDRISIITFSDTATLEYSFTDNQTKSEIINVVSSILFPQGFTHTYDAVHLAISEYNLNSTLNTPKVIYLLTDGVPSPSGNYPAGQSPCSLTTDLDSLNQKFYIIGVGTAWDSTKVDCLVDDPLHDIVFYDNYDTLEFNRSLIIDQLTGLGNLTGSNIELSLDLNTRVTFSNFNENPDNYTTIPGLINTTKWYFDELRVYSQYNITFNFEVNGSETIPLYFETSYLKYTSVSDQNITVPLSELSIQILDPFLNQTTSGAGTESASNQSDDDEDINDYISKLLNLDSDTLKLIAAGFIGFFFLFLIWRRRRKK